MFKFYRTAFNNTILFFCLLYHLEHDAVTTKPDTFSIKINNPRVGKETFDACEVFYDAKVIEARQVFKLQKAMMRISFSIF